MYGIATLEWKRPIAASPELFTTIEQIVRDYILSCSEKCVSSAGLSYAEIFDHKTAEAKYDETNDYKYKEIARKLALIQKYHWDVEISQGIKIKSISTEEILKIPNAGDESILSAEIENASTDYSVSIKIENSQFSPSCRLRMQGPFELIYRFKGDVTQRLKAVTRPWWIARNGLFLFSALCATSFAAGLGINRIFSSPKDENIQYFLLLCIPIFSMIAVSAAIPEKGPWNWMFPKAEFIFGGGVHDADRRRNIRKLLLVLPITLVEIPILVNIISSHAKI